jgi:hypothetical protein
LKIARSRIPKRVLGDLLYQDYRGRLAPIHVSRLPARPEWQVGSFSLTFCIAVVFARTQHFQRVVIIWECSNVGRIMFEMAKFRLQPKVEGLERVTNAAYAHNACSVN